MNKFMHVPSTIADFGVIYNRLEIANFSTIQINAVVYFKQLNLIHLNNRPIECQRNNEDLISIEN